MKQSPVYFYWDGLLLRNCWPRKVYDNSLILKGQNEACSNKKQLYLNPKQVYLNKADFNVIVLICLDAAFVLIFLRMKAFVMIVLMF